MIIKQLVLRAAAYLQKVHSELTLDECKDHIDDAIVTYYEKISEGTNMPPLTVKWLFFTAHNHYRNSLKHKGKTLSLDDILDAEELFEANDTAEERLIELDLIAHYIITLDDTDKRIITFTLEGYLLREIANLLEMKIKAVEKRYERAIKKMRKIFLRERERAIRTCNYKRYFHFVCRVLVEKVQYMLYSSHCFISDWGY